MAIAEAKAGPSTNVESKTVPLPVMAASTEEAFVGVSVEATSQLACPVTKVLFTTSIRVRSGDDMENKTRAFPEPENVGAKVIFKLDCGCQPNTAFRAPEVILKIFKGR